MADEAVELAKEHQQWQCKCRVLQPASDVPQLREPAVHYSTTKCRRQLEDKLMLLLGCYYVPHPKLLVRRRMVMDCGRTFCLARAVGGG